MNKDDKIAILGAGLEGKAMAAHLRDQGFTELHVLDEKEDRQAFADLSDYVHIFRSPGVPYLRPELQKHRDRLSSQTRYFFEQCPCPIIGVTGTKGKGTTSTLIFKMLQAAGRDVHLGGNIGEPPVNFLNKLTPDSLVVLELSSFQLEDLDRSPHIAVVLNVSSEHLDVHPSVEAYRMAKKSIVEHQSPEDIAILNADYYGSFDMGRFTPAQVLSYSRKSTTDAHLRGEEILVQGEAVATRADIALRGDHNLENVLPACLAARLLDVPAESIREVLRSFTGLPHRLEFVTEVDGVQYFNDSFSTTPETSIAGVRAFDEPLYLIAGGSDKGANFTEWGEAIAEAKNLEAVLLIGATGQQLDKAIAGRAKTVPAQTLETALDWARENAKPGSVVLLSPACASFDQFENYKKRGERFRAITKT